MGFGHRSCAVIGCPNSGKRLNKWSSTICKIHRCFHGKSPCNFEPPLRLFTFPTELKNKEARIRWSKAIDRQNEKGNLWLPKKSLSVCSEHFASGKPTEDNPDPELNLGYKTPLKPKRKLPQWGQTHLQSAQNVVKVYIYQYCYFKCWAEWRAGLADCNIGDKLCSDNNQSSRRPPHIIQDHGYCFGLAEMEDPNYCTNEACLKKRKEKKRITK